MKTFSFTYNGIDMLETFGIVMGSYDVLIPELRERKVAIPDRSGAYDYGAKYHNERTLRLDCAIPGQLSLANYDTMKYTLSRKGNIVLWDMPDRYFRGQLYEPIESLVSPLRFLQEFELIFACEPYAYALEPTILSSSQPIMPVKYEGTRQAPTRIAIRNTGTTPMSGITITARKIT